jgi:hypothetical protein
MEALPGNNECAKGPADACRTVSLSWQPLAHRKIILLATSQIHNDSLFINGLYQNIFLLYKLFEAIGYAPILLVNEKPNDINTVPEVLRQTRMIKVDEILRNPMPIHIYLEIGMSIDPNLRRLFRMGGARVCKLYLGNILNIDTETPLFYPGMHFAHHVVGEVDQVWVSPHYKQHDEYAAVLNHVKPDEAHMKIAPYIWDPIVLTLDGLRRPRWRSRRPDEEETFVILEPNISFQKSGLLPLLMVERYYRLTKKPVRVFLGNGERFQNNPFFTKTILPMLTLARDGLLTLSGRHDMVSIMNQHPHATAVCHQWNNQYNYMILEYLYAGFPVVHNAPDWADVGYYYKENSVEEGAAAVLRAQKHHATNLEYYKSGAEALRWRHSPYNPDVQKAWIELLS